MSHDGGPNMKTSPRTWSVSTLEGGGGGKVTPEVDTDQ